MWSLESQPTVKLDIWEIQEWYLKSLHDLIDLHPGVLSKGRIPNPKLRYRVKLLFREKPVNSDMAAIVPSHKFSGPGRRREYQELHGWCTAQSSGNHRLSSDAEECAMAEHECWILVSWGIVGRALHMAWMRLVWWSGSIYQTCSQKAWVWNCHEVRCVCCVYGCVWVCACVCL